jgi:predicted ATP-grasp superfamily ATP-dependent carboligase
MQGQIIVDGTTPAVVLKLDPNVMHHGGLGVIRSLGRAGVPVYGVHEDALAPAGHSRYLRGRWLWNPEIADTDHVLGGLERLAERIGRPAVLIPTDDAGAIFLAEHGERLRRWFRFPAPASDLPRRVAGKYSLYELCREVGFACPEAIQTNSWSEIETFVRRVGYPVVGKLATPWSAGSSGVRSTTIVHTGAELSTLYHACRTAANSDLMLQEFIPGDASHDWFFHGYCDSSSRCRPAFVGVKERSYPAHAGLTSLGRCVSNSVLQNEVTQLLAAVSYRGIVDLDLRWDARDNRYKLLDFNPRLGAQFRLFRDATGVDVALAAYLDLTDQPVPDGDPLVGRRFLVENYDPIAALRYWRRGELGLKAWADSLRGVDETAWFARDDLAPFGLMCLRMGWRAMTRPWGRRSERRAAPLPVYRPGRAVADAVRRNPPTQLVNPSTQLVNPSTQLVEEPT